MSILHFCVKLIKNKYGTNKLSLLKTVGLFVYLMFKESGMQQGHTRYKLPDMRRVGKIAQQILKECVINGMKKSLSMFQYDVFLSK